MTDMFECSAFELKQALAAVKPAVPTRCGASPFPSCVKLTAHGDGFDVTGTDLDLTVRVNLAAATSTDDGAILVPFATLAGFVKSATARRDWKVTVKRDDERPNVLLSSSDGATLAAPVLHLLEDYPRDTVTLDGPAFEVAADRLAALLPFTSTDEARPILTAVAFDRDGGWMAATDSYRLGVSHGPLGVPLKGADDDERPTVLVPRRSLLAAVKAFGKDCQRVTFTTSTDGRHVDMSDGTGRVVVTARTVDGEFPNWSRLIPEARPITLNVDRAALLSELDAIKALGKQVGQTPVRLSNVGGDLTGVRVAFTCQDVCDRVVDVSGTFTADGWPEDADGFTVAFNPVYLRDLLAAGVQSDRVILEGVDHMRPWLVKGVTADGSELVGLLMPVRV